MPVGVATRHGPGRERNLRLLGSLVEEGECRTVPIASRRAQVQIGDRPIGQFPAAKFHDFVVIDIAGHTRTVLFGTYCWCRYAAYLAAAGRRRYPRCHLRPTRADRPARAGRQA